MIVIHGTPWGSGVWVPYAKAPSSRYRVFIFDNPGYGQSSAVESVRDGSLSASIATQARAFAALFHHCWGPPSSIQKPHVVAHDYGGIIGLRATLLHDCQYASLCLIDVVAVRPFSSPFFRLVAKNEDVFNQIPEANFEGLVRAYINGGRYKPPPPGVEDMLAGPWLAGGSQGQTALIRQMVQIDQKDVEEVDSRYGEVRKDIPVKVIWGIDDQWIPVDRAQKLGDMIGAKEVVLVEEASHLIMYDQPELASIEIALWLSEVAPAPKGW